MYDSVAFSISAGIIVLLLGMCRKNDTPTIHVAERCAEIQARHFSALKFLAFSWRLLLKS